MWRIVPATADPLEPNLHGARWNKSGIPALYTSLDRPTVLAEWRYRLSLEPQAPSKPFTLYSVRVALRSVADLTGAAALASVGIRPEHLRQINPDACQEVGALADWMHQDGLLVPSARATGNNLVVLTAQVDPNAPLESTRIEDLKYSENDA